MFLVICLAFTFTVVHPTVDRGQPCLTVPSMGYHAALVVPTPDLAIVSDPLYAIVSMTDVAVGEVLLETLGAHAPTASIGLRLVVSRLEQGLHDCADPPCSGTSSHS